MVAGAHWSAQSGTSFESFVQPHASGPAFSGPVAISTRQGDLTLYVLASDGSIFQFPSNLKLQTQTRLDPPDTTALFAGGADGGPGLVYLSGSQIVTVALQGGRILQQSKAGLREEPSDWVRHMRDGVDGVLAIAADGPVPRAWVYSAGDPAAPTLGSSETGGRLAAVLPGRSGSATVFGAAIAKHPLGPVRTRGDGEAWFGDVLTQAESTVYLESYKLTEIAEARSLEVLSVLFGTLAAYSVHWARTGGRAPVLGDCYSSRLLSRAASVVLAEPSPPDLTPLQPDDLVALVSALRTASLDPKAALAALMAAGALDTAVRGAPVALFQGYDTFMSEGRSPAVSGQHQSGGAGAETYCQVCYDFNSLQSALHVSSSVNASFGFGSVDAKSDFIKKLSITNTSVTIVVYTNIITEARTQTDVHLIGEPPKDIDAFCQLYGDSYLNRVTKGAEYAATYVFYSQSVEQQQQLTAILMANGITSGTSLSASLQTSLRQVQQQVTTRQTLKQYMSGFTETPIFPPADQIIDFALTFGKKVPDRPVVISYETTGYEHVPDMPASFSSVKATRALYNGIGAQAGLAEQHAQLRAVENTIGALHIVYRTYGYTGDSQLDERQAVIGQDILTLDLLFNQMDGEPTKTYTAPQLQGLRWGEPALNVRLQQIGPYGGPGGDPFQQMNETSVAASLVLKALNTRGEAVIDQLATTYSSDQRTAHYVQGVNGGIPSPPLLLQVNERVQSISGTYGTDYLHSLKIVTSFGNEWAWPPSPDGCRGKFSWTPQDQSVAFLGFAGRSGAKIDQLSIVTAEFLPALWG